MREPCHERLAPLVDELIPAISPELDRPFALFGHSMGALIAYELTRALRSQGLPTPRLLVASGRSAPQLPRRRRPIHDLPEPEFREELRRLNGTPQAVLDHNELMSLFSPVIRADLAMNETYIYQEQPPLDLPLLALGGDDDPWVTPPELMAWGEQAQGSFTMENVPGDHFFLQGASREVLAIVSHHLARVMEPSA